MMRRFLGLCLLLLALLVPAAAQEQGPELGQQDAPTTADPISPDASVSDFLRSLNEQQDPGQQIPEQQDFRILVIGDALSGGLGAGMTRLSEAGDGIIVTYRYNNSSGIARPEIYDWAEAITKITEDRQFDAVAVMLGSNDRQDIRLGEFRYTFKTPDWITSYTLQLDTILDVIKSKGMHIYWVSLPPMAERKYNDDMTMLNGIFKERVEAQGGTFIDIRPAFLASDGTYADRGPDDTGTVRKLRASDGVSFFKAGNNRLAQLVLAAIDEHRKSGPMGTSAAPGPTATDGSGENVQSAPILGQSLGGGVSESFVATELVAALAGQKPKPKAEKVETDAGPSAALPSIISVKAASGSRSERLLTTGVSPAPPAGRFDDYSYQPPAQ
jgi:uncharacterized protein